MKSAVFRIFIMYGIGVWQRLSTSISPPTLCLMVWRFEADLLEPLGLCAQITSNTNSPYLLWATVTNSKLPRKLYKYRYVFGNYFAALH